MSEDNAYKPGDIVWVKLNNVWWPGEVTAMDEELLKDTKKKPYCMVKFFNEDFVEFVKTSKQIFPFQCARKAELLKKGMDLFKAKNKFMEKFPDDVKLAERLCPASRRSSDTIIINDRPDSIVKAVMGESVAHLMSDYVEEPSRRSLRPSMDSVTKIMNITPRLKTPPLQQGHNKGSAVAMNATAATSSSPSSSTPKMLSATYTPPSSSNQNAMVYRCPSCNFQTSRLNVSIMHRKMHSGGPAAAATSTPPSRPSAAKTPTTATPSVPITSAEQKTPATTTPRQRKAAEAAAPTPKPEETNKTPVEVPPTKGRPSSGLASKKPETTGGEKLKRNAKKSEARSNGQSPDVAAVSPATTPTSTRPPLQKADSEEIRKRLLADWSDEDEEKDKDEKMPKKARGSKGGEEAPPPSPPQKGPSADKHLTEPQALPTEARSSPKIANNNNLDSLEAPKETAPPKSRSIRNIPKKDRRALKEFNADGEATDTVPAVVASVEEVLVAAATTTTATTTIEEVPTPPEEATEPPKDTEVEDKCNDSGATAAGDLPSGEEEPKILDNGGEGEPEVVPSSCFDFPDEEETESDVLTSIANFKKKYLSPEKAPAANRSSVEEPSAEAVGGDATEKPKVDEKDLVLAAEIDNLLEQTSGTVHEVSAVSVKTLPIKERGKRIFKSRNKSKMDEEDVPAGAEDVPTEPTLVEADCTDRVGPLLGEGEDEKAPEEECVTPPTNGENKENLGLSTEEEAVAPEVNDALEKPDKEAERLKDSKDSEMVIRDSPVTVLNSEEIRNGHSRSPTEETSSVGISEAGAEFGSPASMLDEERFPRTGLERATPIMKERSETPRKDKSPPSEEKDQVESTTKEKPLESEFGEEPEEISLGAEPEEDEDEIESPPHEELSNHPLDSKKQKLLAEDNVEDDEEDEEEDEEEIESPPCEALSGNELEEELNRARLGLGKTKLGRKSKSPRTIGTNSSSATPTPPSPTSTMAEDSQSSLSLRRSGRKPKASLSSPNLVTTSGENKDVVEVLEVEEEPHTNYIESLTDGGDEDLKDDELKPNEEKKASKGLPSPGDVTSHSPVGDKSAEEVASSPGGTRRATRRSPTEAKESESLPTKRSRRSLKSPADRETPSKESENCVEIVFTENQVSRETPVIPIEAQLDSGDETSQASSSFLLNAIELVEGEESCADGGEQGGEVAEQQAEKKTPASNGRAKPSAKKEKALEKAPLRRKIVDTEAASATTPKVRRTAEGKATKLGSPERQQPETKAKADAPPTEESRAAKGASPKQQQKDAPVKASPPAGSQPRPARPPKKEMSFSISKRRTALPSLVPRKKSLSQDAAVIILDSPTKDETFSVDSPAAHLLIDAGESAAVEEPTLNSSTIITTSAGMFDINDIPMVLSNDEELLSTSATAMGGSLAEGPQIIKQQILQPAHSPVPKRPKSVAELTASPSPDPKQLSVDSRGNKYFIVKTEASTTPAAGKVKSPGAAVTGGRKQAGNTIALPGHQQRSQKDTAAQRTPASGQRQRPAHVAAAKVAKMVASDSLAAQELPSTSKAAQSLITSDVHPILNRKPKTQPQQHRGTPTKRSPSQGATGLRKPQMSSSEQAPEEAQIVGATPPQAVHSTTYSEEQLGQMQTDDQQLEGASKILAVPTQPIPGYSETFLLCTLVNNSYRPIDNVPLYLDHDLNQLVPVPLDALDGQPHLIVDHPPPEEDDDVVVGQLTMSTTAAAPGASQQQQLVLPTAGVSLDTVEADSSTQFLCGGTAVAAAVASSASLDGGSDGDDVSQSPPAVPVSLADDSTGGENSLEAGHEMASLVGGDAETEADADEGPNEIVPSNALILNIEGQQIIMDSSTIAHLLANPDANTQLVTDDGTEFVLTREVLAALEAQQTHNLEAAAAAGSGEASLVGEEVASPADILAVALAGSNLYGSDVLQIETSQHLPLLGPDGSIVFPAAAAAALGAAHLTPPITAHTSETNAVLNPIMSTLESPSTSVAGGGVSTTSTTAALLATSVAAGLPPHQRPNLEDSLAVIGVTAPSSSVPISLELPITVTNPAIAPPKTLLPPPPTDIEQFQSSSSVAELTAAAAAAINEASAVYAAESLS